MTIVRLAARPLLASMFLVGGLDGEEEALVHRHRPAAPEGVDRAGDVPRAGQIANSVINGTWSDGRVQARHGS